MNSANCTASNSVGMTLLSVRAFCGTQTHRFPAFRGACKASPCRTAPFPRPVAGGCVTGRKLAFPSILRAVLVLDIAFMVPCRPFYTLNLLGELDSPDSARLRPVGRRYLSVVVVPAFAAREVPWYDLA